MTLECASYREPEAVPLSWKEEAREFLGETEFGIRVVVVDQAERNVDDRDLNAKLDTDARPEIAEIVEHRLIDLEQAVLLYVATKEQLLYLRGQRGRTAEAVAAAKLVDEIGLCQKPALIVEQATELVSKFRSISK